MGNSRLKVFLNKMLKNIDGVDQKLQNKNLRTSNIQRLKFLAAGVIKAIKTSIL